MPKHPAPHLESMPRYCTNHMAVAPVAGGKWLASPNGKTRRWICAACLERRKEPAKCNG